MRSLLPMFLLVAACSATDPAPPAPTAEPAEVVTQWLEAVSAADVDALSVLVEPTGLAVLAGVENRLRSDQLALLLDTGLPGDLATGYWRAFRDDFQAIRGVALSTVVVGAEEPIVVAPGIVAVPVESSGETGSIVTRRSDAAGWQVDLPASFGVALVGPLAEYLESAVDGDHGPAIADAYRVGVLPGLDAAVALDPQDADLVFETEFIRQLLGE